MNNDELIEYSIRTSETIKEEIKPKLIDYFYKQKKVIDMVSARLEYFLIGNLKYQSSQEEFIKLLNILKEYNVKATFFVTGNGNREYIKKAYNEGHSIGIHTYSHVYKNVYASEEAYFNDLEKVQKIIKEQTGEESRLVRFPGGSSNTVSRFNKGIMTRLSKELERRGYKYFDWNVSSSDTVKSNSDDIANTVIRRLKKGNNVVLQHDTKYYSVKAVRKIIEYGLANGYTFAKLDVTSPTVHHGINN